jgi:hypothetical protein
MSFRHALLFSLLLAAAAASSRTRLSAQSVQATWQPDSAYSVTLDAGAGRVTAWTLSGIEHANRLSLILEVEEVRPASTWASNFAVVFRGEKRWVSFETSPIEHILAAPVRIMNARSDPPFMKMRGLGLYIPVQRRVRLSVDWSRPEDVLVAINGAVKRVGALNLAVDTLRLGVSGGRLRIDELTLCGSGSGQPCTIPTLDRSSATELWQPREDSSHPLDLSAIAGLWQIPGQSIWIRLGADGSAFQCRQSSLDRVNTTSGTLSPGGVMRWREHWEDAQVTSEGTRLILHGELNSAVLHRAPDPLPAICGGG